MLVLKLRRIGKKHQASFRLVVAEQHGSPKALGVEDLGWYNPRTKTHEFKEERIQYWMSVGAQATDSVHNLLVGTGVVKGKKRAVHSKAKKTGEAAPAGGAPAVASGTPAPKQ